MKLANDPRTLRDRLQAAMLAQGTGGSWEERAARATEQWVEEQVGDLRTLVRNAEGIVRIFARDNPRWTPAGGQEQDPYGAHAWLAALSRLTQRAGPTDNRKEVMPLDAGNGPKPLDTTRQSPHAGAGASPPAEPSGHRPTIAELEEILRKPDGFYKIEQNPDGSIHAVEAAPPPAVPQDSAWQPGAEPSENVLRELAEKMHAASVRARYGWNADVIQRAWANGLANWQEGWCAEALAAWRFCRERMGVLGSDEIAMPQSDVNDLDAVVHELGIEDSDTTPAEAVRELKAEIERLRAAPAPSTTIARGTAIAEHDVVARLTAWNEGDIDAIPPTYTHDALDFQQDLRRVLKAVAVKTERITQLTAGIDAANRRLVDAVLAREESLVALGVPEEIVKALPPPDLSPALWPNFDVYHWPAVQDLVAWARSQPTATAAQREGETP